MPDVLTDADVGLTKDLSDVEVGLGPSPQKLAAFSLQQGIGIPAKVMGTLAAGAEGSQMTRDMAAARERRMYGADVEAPIAPAIPQQLIGGIQAAKGAASDFMGSLSEFGSDVLRTTGIDPSAMPGRNIIDIPTIPLREMIPGLRALDLVKPGFAGGLETGAGKVVSGFTEPGQAAVLPFAGLKPVQALFGAQALAEVPESIRAIYQAKTPQEAGEALAGAGANIAMGGLIGRHLLTAKGMPYARSLEEAAKVHGDLRPSAGEGARQVPAEGGGERVLAPTEGVAETAQVPLKVLDADELLSPQESVLLQTVAERNGLKGELRIVENFGDPEHKTVAQSGLASVDEKNNFKAPGQVTVSRDALRLWMQSAPEGTLHESVAGMISEELLHSFTTPIEAFNYWDTLTPGEKAISKKLYLGPKTEADVPGGFDDVKAGAEAVRQRVQRMMRLKPTEIAEVAGKERWTRASVEMVARLIRRAREWFGTTAATEGKKITSQILDRMEQNVNAAAESLGAEAPFLLRRSTSPQEGPARDFEDKSGFSFNPAKQIGGMSFEGLSEDQVQALKDAGYGPQWEFTDRRSGSQTEGMTFYVPEGSTPEQINAAYQKKLAAEPGTAAMLRRGSKKEEELPGMAATKGKGVLSKPETAPAAERPFTELQKEPATPAAVDRSSYEHLSQVDQAAAADPKAKPISFNDYAEAMRVKFGPMSTPALVESFERNLWPTLMNASGEKLAALRDKLNLRSKVGSRAVGEPARVSGGFALEAQALDPAQAKEARTRRGATQKYRSNVISAIATRLLGDAVSQAESPTRTEVSPYDLWKQRDRRTGKIKQKEPVQPIYNELSREDQESPGVLQKMLTDDAREMGQKVSTTKRLTVLQNRETGKVEVVSTFRDPRRKAVLLDPQAPAKTHSPLDSILKRYRPIASILLDDPVRSFRQSYDSLGDYENRFGTDAKRAAAPSFGEAPVAEGEEQVPGSWEVNAPITNAEAGAVMDHITGEVGRFDSPDDVRASLDALREDSNRQALSAYRKLFAELERRNPTGSVEELLTQLSKNIYENHKAATGYEDFVNRTMAQGRAPVSEATGGRPLAPDVPKGVESVVQKLSVEPRVVPGGRAGAYIPKPEPSRMLSPQEQAYVAAKAKPEYTPTKPLEPLGDTPEETAQMMNRRDMRDKAEARFWTSLGQVRGLFLRHGAKQDIATEAARASTLPINISQQAKRNIELSSASKKNPDGNLKVLAAARAINAAYINGVPDQAALANLHTMTTDAQAKAAALLRVPTDLTLQVLGLGDLKGASRGEIMSIARQWLHAAEDLQKEVEYAQAHFGDRDLLRTTRALRLELADHLRWERNHGRNTKEAENYWPGLYKGEIYGDNAVTFQSQILGKAFGKPKSFANTYEAINAGPFIPKLNNAAESAAHRIRSGLNSVLSDEAFRSPLHMTDPETGTPIAIEMQLQPGGGYVVPKGMEQYVPVEVGGYGTPLAFRRSYAGLMEDLFGESRFEKSAPLRGIRQAGAIEKHATLAGDVYHFAKMGYYAAAIMWHRAGYQSGYAALEFRPGNMAEAVRRGLIRQKDMDWALTPEQVNVGGQTQTMTRQEISKFLQDKGLNVGRVQDAMYKHFVDDLDVTIGGKTLGLGRYTRFLFDKFTRGIMNQAAVESFVRHNAGLSQAGRPSPAEPIAKRIIGDINTMFGSAGKQALIKNPTLRDLSQLIFLAPQWVGTRISMEGKFFGRLATTPYVAARYGLPEASLHAGPIGRAMGTGLLAMFGITQAINLASRHQLTFQNPEEGHKLDAFIPDWSGGGPGHWVSPLSIFLELTHDVARFVQVGRKDIPQALTEIAGNKLHPVARGILSAATGITPTGQKITTAGGRVKALGTGLLPVPISATAAGRYIGHKVTDRIAPNTPGAGMRQFLSSAGIKSEIEERASTQIQKLADDYMKKNGLKPPTGWQQIQTDEPNYTKLRGAIRSGDNREARKLIDVLTQEHPPKTSKTGIETDPVKHAMELYANHNFTSKEAEDDFYATLTPGQKGIYERAKQEREAELQKFLNLYDTQPGR